MGHGVLGIACTALRCVHVTCISSKQNDERSLQLIVNLLCCFVNSSDHINIQEMVQQAFPSPSHSRSETIGLWSTWHVVQTIVKSEDKV